MATVSNKPWSDVDKTVEAYGSVAKLCAASLINENSSGSEPTAENCKLPVYEPGGALSKGALSSAAGYLNDTDASAEAKAKARRKLLSLYREANMDPPDSIKEASYQTPYDETEAVELGPRLWRKQILPFREINYQGGKLSFDKELGKKIVENHKRRPFEITPFVIGHTDNPEASRGEIKGLSLTADGVDALIETDEDGTKMIERNGGKLPVSVRYHENYQRESDGQNFGPCVEHVAAVFKPRMTDMRPWTAVEASESSGGMVDLSEEEYSDGSEAAVEEVEREVADEETEADDGTPEGETTDDSSEEDDMADMPKEGEKIQFKRGGATHEGTFKRVEGEGDSQVAIVDVDGDEVKVPVSMLNKGASQDSEPKDNSERSGGVDLAELEARDRRIAELESQNRNNTLELRRQKVERELEEYGREGVPAADLSLARPLLMDDDSGVELSYTDLSEDGAEEKKAARGNLVRKMLDSRKGTVEFGEKGDASAQLSEDDAKVQKTQERMKETGESFADAARHIT